MLRGKARELSMSLSAISTYRGKYYQYQTLEPTRSSHPTWIQTLIMTYKKIKSGGSVQIKRKKPLLCKIDDYFV